MRMTGLPAPPLDARRHGQDGGRVLFAPLKWFDKLTMSECRYPFALSIVEGRIPSGVVRQAHHERVSVSVRPEHEVYPELVEGKGAPPGVVPFGCAQDKL